MLIIICLDWVTLNVDTIFFEFINSSPFISSKSLIISLAKVNKNENIENINTKEKELFDSVHKYIKDKVTVV